MQKMDPAVLVWPADQHPREATMRRVIGPMVDVQLLATALVALVCTGWEDEEFRRSGVSEALIRATHDHIATQRYSVANNKFAFSLQRLQCAVRRVERQWELRKRRWAAIRIQAAFRGWRTRMETTFNPHHAWGHSVALRAFKALRSVTPPGCIVHPESFGNTS